MIRVALSNGCHRFHLALVAQELSRAGVLSAFITAAYPTKTIADGLRFLGLSGAPSARRLLQRGANIPEHQINQSLSAEMFSQCDLACYRRFGHQKVSDLFAQCTMLTYQRTAIRALRRTNFTIYHYRSGFGGRSLNLAKERGALLVCDHSIAHPQLLEYFVQNSGRWPKERLEYKPAGMWRRVFNDIQMADFLVVNSDFVRDTFVHQGADAEKIFVVYNNVEEDFVTQLDDVGPVPRDSCMLRVLFASGLDRRKGAEHLLEAFPLVADAGIELCLAGGSSGDWGSRYPDFFKLSNVKRLGHLDRGSLAKAMVDADVLVLPSLAEGSARVIFEAMAAGCYIITTPNSGSIVRDRVHGTLIEPGSTESLVSALRFAKGNLSEVRRIGSANAALVRAEYRQSSMGARMMQCYRQMLAQQSKYRSLERTNR